ncbi:MAG: DUF1653 domain-containing protein [Caldilineaceae bacterium]
MSTIPPGDYRHYKGKHYRVLGTARHSETEEELVVYRQLYGEFGLWVRPAAMFAETVTVDGAEQPRSPLPTDFADSITPGRWLRRTDDVVPDPPRRERTGATPRPLNRAYRLDGRRRAGRGLRPARCGRPQGSRPTVTDRFR